MPTTQKPNYPKTQPTNNPKMRNFRELEIWKEAILLVTDIYRMLEVYPVKEKFNLISQMERCSISIPSNIAEGCRGSDKELKHYLEIALGSGFELETQIEISLNPGYISKDKHKEIIERLTTLLKRINAFRNKLM